MGPVGILCVQRTLDKGRHTGFYTGVGAALSDLFYCLLTGFGLSFIEEFLEKNQNVIQLLGSVVLIAFGVYLFKSNPSRQLKKPTENKISAKKNILSGFLFTFSNPLIIFLVIGLFARFNFLSPDFAFYHYIIGFLSIIAGALFWWYIVTYSVNKVRNHFNLRSMWLINKIIGSVILIFAVVGIITGVSGLAKASTTTPERVGAELERPEAVYFNSDRGYRGFKNGNDTILEIKNSTKARIVDVIAGRKASELTFDFRCSNPGGATRQGFRLFGSTRKEKNVAWGVAFRNGDHSSFLLFKNVKAEDANYDKDCMVVSLRVDGREVSSIPIYDNVDLNGGLNAFRVRIADGHLYLSGGNREYTPLAQFDFPKDGCSSIGFFVDPGGWMKFRDISLQMKGGRVYTGFVKPAIYTKERLSHSKDPLEGYWATFDRMLDDRRMRMGGSYRVAIVKDNRDRYLMVYISGAEKSASQWSEGMVKGILTPSSFADIYDVEWILSDGSRLESDVRAELASDVLTFHFPQGNSTLRMRKTIK